MRRRKTTNDIEVMLRGAKKAGAAIGRGVNKIKTVASYLGKNAPKNRRGRRSR